MKLWILLLALTGCHKTPPVEGTMEQAVEARDLPALAAHLKQKPNRVDEAKALVQAAGYGWLPGVQALVDGGAPVDQDAPLRAAVSHPAVVSYLLAHHAKADGVDANGETPLGAAAAQGLDASVKAMLEAGVPLDPVAMIILGRTQDLEAAIARKPELVTANLVNQGDVRLTALHLAAWHNRRKVARVLLAHHADPNAPGAWGAGTAVTPLALALPASAVARLLRQAGAKEVPPLIPVAGPPRGPEAGAQVTVSETYQLTGGLTPADFGMVVRTYRSQLARCCDGDLEARDGDATLAGDLTVRIGKDGRVTSVTPPGGAPYVQCAADRIKRWAFPKPRGAAKASGHVTFTCALP